MKKLIVSLILTFLFVPLAFGANSVTTERLLVDLQFMNTKITEISWTASDTTAGVSAYNCTSIKGEMFHKIVVDPSGTTAPTALYDIYIQDTDLNYDLMGGNGYNMAATGDGVEVLPYRGDGVYGESIISDSGVSIYIINNSANAAFGKIYIITRYED